MSASEISVPSKAATSWRDALLLATDEFEAPPVILRVGNSVIGTLGNFSATTGKAKSKKTFNVCAIVAAAMTGGTVLNYSAFLPPGKRKILYADTEQSEFHCKRVINRILRLAGLPLDAHPDTLMFLCLRKYTTAERLRMIEEAIYEIDDLGLVIIDGIRDLTHDINSPGESTDLITKLMRWTDERKIHIHTVLHLNKGDDNTRGHLGTELNNKAETVLQITKDDFDKDISFVASSYIRDMDFRRLPASAGGNAQRVRLSRSQRGQAPRGIGTPVLRSRPGILCVAHRKAAKQLCRHRALFRDQQSQTTESLFGEQTDDPQRG